MDNFSMTVCSEGKAQLSLAIAIAFTHAPGGRATHYTVRPLKENPKVSQLLLCWSKDDSIQNLKELPYELSLGGRAEDFVWNWLEAQGHARANRYDDGDVENGDGAFVAEVGDWGHAGGSHYGVVLITPVFAWYGK